jgi:hypothetical protein
VKADLMVYIHRKGEVMNTPSFKQGLAALVVVLTLGAAGGALAQNAVDGTGATDGTGGTTSDTSSAGNIHGGGMPQIQQQGGVSFVSGGVGLDESTALERAQRDWPLAMRFTGPGAQYLADVRVRIVNAHNAEVFRADARGPYMLVKLPPGRYTVHAAYKGQSQTKAVTISGSGSTKASFSWAAP